MTAVGSAAAQRAAMDHDLAKYARLCGTAADHQLSAIADGVEQAQRLLSGSLTQLRESFEQLMPVVPPESCALMEQAMVALQSEDVAGQLLGHIRHRTLMLNTRLQRLTSITWLLARAAAHNTGGAASVHCLRSELRDLSAELTAMELLHQPVAQHAPTCGPAELF